MYFVFYGLHDTTLQICIISLYECFAYDITVVVKINLFQCQCQCQYILHYFMQDVHADFESPIVSVHLLLRTTLILYSIFVVVTGLCARYKIL